MCILVYYRLRLIYRRAGYDRKFYFRTWREEADQEFIALTALLLCGDLKLKTDTFQAITNKLEVGNISLYNILYIY